jgi:hypothetical protein
MLAARVRKRAAARRDRKIAAVKTRVRAIRGRARGLTIRLQELDEESRSPTSQDEGKQGARRKYNAAGAAENSILRKEDSEARDSVIATIEFAEWRAPRAAVAQADAEWGALEIEPRRSGSQKRRL